MSHKLIRGLLLLLLPLIMPACLCFGGGTATVITAWGRLSGANAPDCSGYALLQPADGIITSEETTLFSWSPAINAQIYVLTFFNIQSPLPSRIVSYETTETSMVIDTSTNNLGDSTRYVLQLEAIIPGYASNCVRAEDLVRVTRPPTSTATDIPVASFIPSPSPVDCVLTSPLEGLPNGVATFHWNPVPEATNYEIKLYNDQMSLLTTLGSPTTPLSADVSQNAIGGQYLLYVEFIAYANGVVLCSEQYSLYREAPTAVPATNPPPTIAPATPTNEPTIAPTSEPTPEETPWIDCDDPEIYESPEWSEYCTGEEWEIYE